MTAFGIFWGTTILALCWGGAQGFQGMMNRQFAGFATNLGGILVAPTSRPHAGFAAGRIWSITDSDIDEIHRSVAGIESSLTMSSVRTIVTNDTRQVDAGIIGATPDYWKVQSFKLFEGRYLNESDEAARRKVAIIGDHLAGELFGDESPVGKYIEADGVSYLIVGLAQQMSNASVGGMIDYNVAVPESTLRLAYNIVDPQTFIFTTVSGVKPSEAAEHMLAILRRNHKIAPDDEAAFNFVDVSDMFEMISKVYGGIDLVAVFIGMGTLLAGVIGVGNIMWIIVKERTGEFGIRRAIGATPTDITIQILSESIVLTLVAGLSGVTVAATVLGLADHALSDPWLGKPGFEISFGAAMVVLIMFVIFGVGAGLIPAVKAMKIKPVEAINAK